MTRTHYGTPLVPGSDVNNDQWIKRELDEIKKTNNEKKKRIF